MAVPQRAPKYAPGCPEDNVYDRNYVFNKKRRSNNHLYNLLAILIIICVGVYYWHTHISPINIPIQNDTISQSETSQTFVPDIKKLKIELTSIDRSATSNAIYVNASFSNESNISYYDITTTVTLLDAAGNTVESKTETIIDEIAADKTEQWTYCFNSKDYSSVTRAEIHTEYKQSK